MSKENILITGGAGFIGTALSKYLVSLEYKVTILDCLSPQIHGEFPQTEYQSMFPAGTKWIKGDIRNEDIVTEALKDIDIVIHLASETGTGQSMYEIAKYMDVNCTGTSILMQAIAKNKRRIKKVILASSRAVYGEGKYTDKSGKIVYPSSRKIENMAKGDFSMRSFSGGELEALPTDETSLTNPSSIYGITKLCQENIVENICGALGIAFVILRYQNVYGPGQSLNNPYTGILSIFSTLLIHGETINIFEDGYESRDFVYIDDVVKMTSKAIISDRASGQKINVGTGSRVSVIELVGMMKLLYQSNSKIDITGLFRIGDIKHNYADISKSKDIFGMVPEIQLNNGLESFVKWVLFQNLQQSEYRKSLNELSDSGMILKSQA